MLNRRIFTPLAIQIRAGGSGKRTQENFITRKVDKHKEQNEKRRQYKEENHFDFGKVRCNLEALKKEEKPKQLFPEDPDAPVQLPFNPYEKAARKCLLCELGIKLDYKNARLLQQFISSFSGRVYDRHVTGLCTKQHDNLLKTIALSRRAGYMPALVKDPKYLRDPKLFDPLRPVRPHSYDA